MKKIFKLLITLTFCFSLFLGDLITVDANDSTNFNALVQDRITEELTAYFKSQNINIELSNAICDIDYTQYQNISDIDNSVAILIDGIKTDFANTSTQIDFLSVQPRGIATKDGYYVAKVESIVPAIGWGYICQDFKASVNNSKISSITLQGYSYDTGITLGSWEHNRSWSEISSNKKYCRILMKGTVNYLWEGLNLSMDATFEATGEASGNSIVSSYADWPD